MLIRSWADRETLNGAGRKSRKFRMFKKGDRVEILKEFQDPGDENFTWIVQEDEEKGRVDIVPANIQLEIQPLYVVPAHWIKLTV